MNYMLNIQFYLENTQIIHEFYKVLRMFKIKTIIPIKLREYSVYFELYTEDPHKELENIEKDFGDSYPVTKTRIMRKGIYNGLYYETVLKTNHKPFSVSSNTEIIYDRDDVYLIKHSEKPFNGDNICTIIYEN